VARKENLVVGLDIGTSKVCAIVAEINAEGLEVVGLGTVPSNGLRKGVVVNIDATVESVRRAVEEAELMAGCEIGSVFVGISGGHIKGVNSEGMVAIKNREVTEHDIRRVVEQARAIAIPVDREIIDILPQEFSIDDQDGVRDPLGMNGVKLHAKIHIVTSAISATQNIVRCCSRCGLKVSNIVLEQIASSEAVLGPDEKEIGVALVDIGGGTTDIALWRKGSIRHVSVLALGGDHLTNDIAEGLHTPVSDAEKIKRKYGCAMAKLAGKEEMIQVPSVGGRKPRDLPRQLLCEVIEPRMEEIFQLVHREISRVGMEDLLSAGVVLTGGTALLPGIETLGEQVFEMPVRVGKPQGIAGLTDIVNSPMFATGVGLALRGKKEFFRKGFKSRDAKLFNRIWDRVKEVVVEYFV
jgi:cell division protein FtsA